MRKQLMVMLAGVVTMALSFLIGGVGEAGAAGGKTDHRGGQQRKSALGFFERRENDRL